MAAYARVIPFVRLPRGLDQFDYRIPEALDGAVSPGVVVEVPFRGRRTQGVVFSVADATAFAQVKEVARVPDHAVRLCPWQLELMAWMSQRYFTSMGAIAPLFAPPIPKRAAPAESSRACSGGEQPSCRLSRYVRSSTRIERLRAVCTADAARGKQTLIITPFAHDAQRLAKQLDSAILFDAHAAAGAQYRQWKEIASGAAQTIVGTRSALFAPCSRPGTLVIDAEESEFHKQEEPNPRYHVRETAHALSRFSGCDLELLTCAPSLDSLHAVREKRCTYLELDPVSALAEAEVIDMGNEAAGGNFSPISYPLEQAIAGCLEARRACFLFLNRKGSAGAFACGDCGHLFLCPTCLLPLTYHDTGKLRCHHCRTEAAAPSQCPKCRSIRLRPRGTGTERLDEIIREKFPAAKVLRLEADAPIERDESALASAADIIVGTVYALPFLPAERLGLVAAVSADTLFHIPDFRSIERTYAILSRLQALAGDAAARFLVQTHAASSALFEAIRHRSAREYYLAEIAERQLLAYPPYGRVTRIVITDTDRTAGERMAKEAYARLAPAADTARCRLSAPAPAHVFKVRDRYRWQMQLRSAADIPADLRAILISLPESVIIDADPEQLA